MKLKNIIAFISFTAFLSVLSSCGDSYMPITLVSLDGKTSYYNNDTVSLIKFTDGEQFNIKGGNGKYNTEIRSDDDNICIEDSYTTIKNILTLRPVSDGECFLYVSDVEKNSARFIIQVKNLDKLYSVKEIRAIADGDELMKKEIKQIEESLYRKAIVGIGGRFNFQYLNKNFDSGKLTINRTETNNESSTYFFSQEKPYFDTEGNKIEKFNVYESVNQGMPTYVLLLSERKAKDKTEIVLSQDFTEELKGNYQNKLEKAYIEYILSTTKEATNNAK